MMAKRRNPKRILSIDPTSRGFGFAVFEVPMTLVDWGNKAVKKQHEGETLATVLKVINQDRPEIMVLEDCRESRRGPRVRQLLDKVQDLAEKEGLETRRISVSKVKQVFRAFGAKTKHEIAHAVAKQVPALAAEIPRYRKAWMSEATQMGFFDAAALALTYIHLRLMRRGGTQSPAGP